MLARHAPLRMSAADWIPIGISLASLGFAILAFRSSRPRVRVTMKSAFLVGESGTRWANRSAVFVEVTNKGASPVQVQAVELVSAAGSLTGESNPHTQSVPCAIEGNGGRGIWLFDRYEMRAVARADGGDQQIEFRAVVTSGRTRYRSRDVEAVHPLEPTRTPMWRAGARARIGTFINSWARPRLQVDMITRVEFIDLKAGTYRVGVTNHGGGIARGVTLELMRERQGPVGRLELERVGPPVPVGWIARKKTRTVTIPLQDEEDLTWWVRHDGRARSGTGATTRRTATEILTRHPADSRASTS